MFVPNNVFKRTARHDEVRLVLRIQGDLALEKSTDIINHYILTEDTSYCFLDRLKH